MAVEYFPVGLAQKGERHLSIQWNDGTENNYLVRRLRLVCACAECVDEWTKEPKLNPNDIPEDIKPLNIETVGRYALHIAWSDGHRTGIYPFATLKQLAQEWKC